MKSKLIVIIAIILLMLIASIYWWTSQITEEIDKPSPKKEYILDFEQKKVKLYIRARSWGLAGSHEEIILSTKPFDEGIQYSNEDCYIFYTSEIYYKKIENDTLMVLVDNSSVSNEFPKNFHSSIKIKLLDFKNNIALKDTEKNYQKYGLSKVSIYN